ncbi:hypothetical protein CDAR_475441, partial [Caerostris darwini]
GGTAHMKTWNAYKENDSSPLSKSFWINLSFRARMDGWISVVASFFGCLFQKRWDPDFAKRHEVHRIIVCTL